MTLHLQVRHASKAYAGIPALSDAAIDLHGGELLGLVGENGAGKSTLVKLLAGLERADSLQLRMNGQPIHISSAADARRLGLRFIHQELHIVPALSVAENLFLNHPLPGMGGLFVNRAKLYRQARAALDRLGIAHIDLRARASQLSPGDAMLTQIASAFIGADADTKPLIYILDEPTAALNQAEVELLFAVLARLRARGCALLVVTHRLQELFRIAQRVTVMRDGRVVNAHDIESTDAAQLIREMTGDSGGHIPVASVTFAPTHANETPLLMARDLSSDHLASASFSLRAGEIVGVAGLAGAGRSQLLQAIMGIDARRGGRLELDGTPLGDSTTAQRWQMGMAYLPEERRSQGLLAGWEVSRNMTLPHLDRFRRWHGFVNESAESARSQELSQAVQLRATGISQRTRQLSGGNQQKVMFARAMLGRPRVALLDEPTRGVDVGAKRDIYRLIRELAAGGAGILLASSELEELLALCGRVLIMRERRLVDDAATQGMNERDLLSRMFAAEIQPRSS